jgi:glyoxylase-like metal-dependent hydrolase (beta-lactamase superfamily II)
MRIVEDVYLVGGGMYGVGISNDLDCNVFLVDGQSEMALIDTGVGEDTSMIIDNIKKEGLDISKVSKLILTHAHLDHSGGTAGLKKSLGLKVYISEIEAEYLENGDEDAIGLNIAKRTGVYAEHYSLTPVKIDQRLKGGESIKIGKYTTKVIPTPGHSRGSVCLLLEGHTKRVLFSGDTVFTRGELCLLNLPDSSLADYREGLKNLANLSIDTLLPSHIGFTINKGQAHIDMALEALQHMELPGMM